MGKKGKKKTGKQHKKRMKARAEKREEQFEDEPSVDSQHIAYGGEPREFLDGDYVRYYDGHDRESPPVQRGIISKTINGKELPKGEFEFTSYNKTIKKIVNETDIYPDIYGTQLRFREGSIVLCKSVDCTGIEWTKCEVKQLWPRPIEYIDNHSIKKLSNPVYLCHLVSQGNLLRVYEDTDQHIREPLTIPRFNPGDKVVFNSMFAEGIETADRYLKGGWLDGKVIAINPRIEKYQLTAFVGRYVCSFWRNRKEHQCYLLEDNDEAIAMADPRTRMMDAIEQDCSYEHLCYLINEYDIDVSAFQDLFIAKAIEHGSYNALWWAEKHMNVKLQHVKNENGTIMQQIARTPNLLRFMKKTKEMKVASENLDYSERKGLRNVWILFDQYTPNNERPSFLLELISSENILALDYALSLSGLGYLYLTENSSLNHESLQMKGNILDSENDKKMMMRYIIQKALVLKDIWMGATSISNAHSDRCIAKIHSHFAEPNTTLQVKRCIRLQWDLALIDLQIDDLWEKQYEWKMKMDVLKLAEVGEYNLFKAFIEADETLSHGSQTLNLDKGKNLNEFIQSELCNKQDNEPKDEKLGLMDILVCGKVQHKYIQADNFWRYSMELSNFIDNGGNIADDWLIHLKSKVKIIKDGNKDDDYYALESIAPFDRRIFQMEDDSSLEDRLQIIEYLVMTKKFKPPCAFLAIECRKCGVLHWLFKKEFIKLEAEPINVLSLETYLRKHHDELEFARHINFRSQSVGYILCFACIHYDDFQTLVWLIKEFGVKSLGLHANKKGLNPIHITAYFGRIEIMYFLRTLDSWKEWLHTPVCGGILNGMYSSHVAVSRGHVDIAEKILLCDVCPSIDLNSLSVIDHASKSEHEFVQEWGSRKKKPLELDADIKEFMNLLGSSDRSEGDLKDFLVKTRCMDPGTWYNCGRYNTDDSFRKLVQLCCEATTCDFSLWLCSRIMKEELDSRMLDTFCGGYQKITGRDYLSICNDEDISTWLKQPWADGVECTDQTSCLYDPNNTMKFVESNDLKHILARKLMRIETLQSLRRCSLKEMKRLLFSSTNMVELESMMTTIRDISEKLGGEDLISSRFSRNDLIEEGKVNMNSYIHSDDYKINESHQKNRFFLNYFIPKREKHLHSLLISLSGYSILQFCLFNHKNLSARMEFEMLYDACCLNRKDVVDIFLDHDDTCQFSLSRQDYYWIAALAAAERGQHEDLVSYLKECDHHPDPVLVDFQNLSEDPHELSLLESKFHDEEIPISLSEGPIASLSLFMLYGFMMRHGESSSSSDPASISKNRLELMSFASISAYQPKHLLLAAVCILDHFIDHEDVFIHLWSRFLIVVECFSSHEIEKEGTIITSNFVKKVLQENMRMANDQKENNVITSCLELALRLGIDIEKLLADSRRYFVSKNAAVQTVQSFILRQRSIYQQFDIVKNGCSVLDLQIAIESGMLDINTCDRVGLFLEHIASVYDRVDILEYLVANTEDCLTKLDRQNRSVLEVARSTRAVNATEWIEKRLATKTISLFSQSNYRRRKAQLLLKTSILGFKKSQAVYRGYKVRQKMRDRLLIHAETSRRFQLIWFKCIDHLKAVNIELQCWISIREYFLDFAKAADLASLSKDILEEITDTMDKLDIAMNIVQDDVSMYTEDNGDDEGEVIDVQTIDKQTKTHPKPTSETFVNIQYTSHVAKWLKHGDPKYRDFFVRRIRQLSAGERSRILAKRLKGSKTTIFETYLEQKSGFRILWTTEGNNILVWYIAKHDAVSRLVERIDDSQSRSSRQLASAVDLLEEENAAVSDKKNDHGIILDPLENVPLKVYEVPVHNIGNITDKSWIPRLKLTDEERDVVETNGTVLLLGRSGTGKTICICNRMDHDSQKMADDPSFSQLFVARSQKLCKYVSEAIGVLPNTTFTIFDTLLSQLQNQLPNLEYIKNGFPRSNRMTFDRFKSEVYNRNRSIDPLLVWTSIRSFIKGSIEAATNVNHTIDKEEFLSFNLFGSKRCRLTLNQREEIYCIYEQYKNYMQGSDLWDDCDRITTLLQRLEYCKTSNHELYHQLRKSKIYVDEVQDYTQAEILLFFYLSGPGNLFFAGDPAQSVVEGVEFRFEDIRSVEYHIATDHNNLILQKPKTVNVNFRSHAGILNTAGAILSCMFGAFPHSAKQLKEDQGVFLGPRPSVFYKVHDNVLSSLISDQLNGIVVLVHDSNVSRCRRALGGYPLVYGIRAAKGLEFKSVIMLNFFADLPSNIQKAWRDLLLGRVNEDFQYAFPEVEGQLKLLYTGVTRCIQQLFFAETTGSIAGDAFVRWITTTTISRNNRKSNTEKEKPLATRSNLGDVQVMSLTNDEWISSGIENAEAAEDCENNDLSSAESLLDKAIYCFQQANEDELARKARVHRCSIQFRLKLPPVPAWNEGNQDGDGDIEDDFTAFEVEAAGIVESLVRENLLNEAKGLCESILPYMSGYAKKQLQVNIISKLN